MRDLLIYMYIPPSIYLTFVRPASDYKLNSHELVYTSVMCSQPRCFAHTASSSSFEALIVDGGAARDTKHPCSAAAAYRAKDP